MDTVTLGMTDLSVSPIALGTWELGGEWGTFSEQNAINTIRRARELGVNLFDTAQGYGFGASERLLGHALRAELDTHRETIVIATKGGLRMTDNGCARDSSREWLRQGVADSLRALGVDYIDLYQVHWPDPTVSFAETADALEELTQEGKIRHVGVSNFSAAQMAEFTTTTRPVETNQVPYSLFRRDIETDVLPYAGRHDVGILAHGPLAHGLLTGALDEQSAFEPGDWRSGNPSFSGETYRRNLETVGELQRFAEQFGSSVAQVALAWTLASPAVQVAIVGARRTRHIEEAIVAAELRLGEPELDRIDQIMAGAMAFTGPAPELMPSR